MANTLPGTPYVESSDLVANYPAVSESLAERVDLVGILPFATSTARGTALPTPTDGQFSYLQDSNSTEFWNGSAWQALSSGKILQVVRATDTTLRTTTSTSFVDASISVTITPQKNTSNILLIWSCQLYAINYMQTRITNSSNVVVSGAELVIFGSDMTTQYTQYQQTLVGWASPATTSAVTYKGRFLKQASGTAYIANDTSTGQLFAIEVAA